MENLPHILIVDDDREIRELLARFLTKHGLRTSVAKDGPEMLQVLDGSKIDLIVLDLMLPGEDGLSLCRRLRVDSVVPIIMLTAMGEDTDRIIGLEMGADDYIPKPFNPRELLARIKAVLRRFNSLPIAVESTGLLRFMDFNLNFQVRKFCKGEDEIELTGGEFDLLYAFLTHPGRVLSRDQLLDLTKGRNAAPFDRSIDIQVSRLRKKIENSDNPEIIKTVRGGGYIFTPKVTKC